MGKQALADLFGYTMNAADRASEIARAERLTEFAKHIDEAGAPLAAAILREEVKAIYRRCNVE